MKTAATTHLLESSKILQSCANQRSTDSRMKTRASYRSPSLFRASIRHYNWKVSRVHDEWFINEGAAVCRVVGLLKTPPSPPIEKKRNLK